jgi:hypothetical protein
MRRFVMISRDCKLYYVESKNGKDYFVYDLDERLVLVQESEDTYRVLPYNFNDLPINTVVERLESGMFDLSDNELLIEYMLAVLLKGENGALLFLRDKYCPAILERLECILKGK